MQVDNSAAPAEPGKSVWNDVAASVVVFLVALPLCMGIAIASGVPPERGIVTGIIGGLIVGLFSGSPLQVSGPAAGLSVIVMGIVQNDNILLAGLGPIVLMAGGMQLLAGIFRLGQWFRAVSPAVVQGMLAGIGILIIASQLHVMVDDKPRNNAIENLRDLPEAVMKGLYADDDNPKHHSAARIGVLTIAIIVGWNLLPKKIKVVPAPLIAVVVATFITEFWNLKIDDVKLPDDLTKAIAWPAFANFSTWFSGTYLTSAVTIAVVASAETLLCATAVDQLHRGPRTRYDKELAAQGIGNMLCGLVGALPMTGVIVRSSANIEAGARSRLSAILHGAWLLALVVLFPDVLKMIPVCSLAAVLVFTGYKLVNIKAIKHLWDYGRSEVFIYLATVTMIVVEDLLTGVLVGVALSTVKLLYRVSHLAVRLEEDRSRKRATLYLNGSATFLRLPKLAAELEKILPGTELHVHFEELSYIDHACLDLLMNWERQHAATGGSLNIDWETLKARFHSNGNGVNGQTKLNGATSKKPADADEPMHAINGR